MNYDEAIIYVSTLKWEDDIDDLWEELTPIDNEQDLIVHIKGADKKTIRWGIITLIYWVAWIIFLVIYKW